MLQEGEEIPKKISRYDDLEKVPRGTHRLKNKSGEIWTRDRAYVYIQRELNSNMEEANIWLQEEKFTVLTEEEAFPGRYEEQKKAEQNAPGPETKIKAPSKAS